jgi:hypothetical protein
MKNLGVAVKNLHFQAHFAQLMTMNNQIIEK